MSIAWSEITVDLDCVNPHTLLVDWRWLVDASIEPILVTAMGDAFLEDPDGHILWLDVAAGTVTPVAENGLETLVFDKSLAEAWFMPQVVLALKNRGVTLGKNEVFSLSQPAVLGGKYALENIRPTDIEIHFSVNGQIHEQVKDLAPGTRICEVELV